MAIMRRRSRPVAATQPTEQTMQDTPQKAEEHPEAPAEQGSPAPARKGPKKKGDPEALQRLKEVVQHSDSLREGTNYIEIVKRYKAKIRNPKTAIRAKCIECSGGSIKEVQMCPITSCALYLFRLGKNPFHSRSKEHNAPGQDGADHGEDEHDDEHDDDNDA